MKAPASSAPEFSGPIAIDKIPPQGRTEYIEADEHQRAALAKRFSLIELPALQAEFYITPAPAGQTFNVTGKVRADVVQRCVVTLEPLPGHIENEVDVVFAASVSGEPDLDPLKSEVEPIVNGVIDLGELAAQHLGVALEPYPRKAGAPFVEAEYGDSQKRENPFARLAEISKKPKDHG